MNFAVGELAYQNVSNRIIRTYIQDSKDKLKQRLREEDIPSETKLQFCLTPYQLLLASYPRQVSMSLILLLADHQYNQD